jgi:hypothetical protein
MLQIEPSSTSNALLNNMCKGISKHSKPLCDRMYRNVKAFQSLCEGTLKNMGFMKYMQLM